MAPIKNYWKRLIAVIIIGLVCNTTLSAQLADSIKILVQDGWIEKMDNNFILKVGLNNNYESFSQQTSGLDYFLFPNITTNLRFEFNYRFISAGVEFAPNFFPGNGDEEIYGNTKSFSLGLSMIFSHWAITTRYSKVKGYYLRNTPDFDPMWQKGDPYIQLPNQETNVIILNLGYSFNQKLSLKSFTSFTERQLKSAGSFIPAINFEYFKMNANNALLDSIATNPVSSNYEWVIGPAYVYTFVFKKIFFASIGAHIGVGMVHTNFAIESLSGAQSENQNNMAIRWDSKAGVGYNGRDFFAGFYVNISDLYYNQNNNANAPVQDLNAFYQLVFGVRLESPKWVKKQMKKLDDKIKL